MFRLEGMSAGRAALIVAAFLIGSSVDLATQDTENPYTSLEDVETGDRLFRIHCSRCHGIDAAGDDGPSLRRGRFRRAQSDTGLFRVISDGVANTGMPPIFRRRTDRSGGKLLEALELTMKTDFGVFVCCSKQIPDFPKHAAF